MAVFSNYAFRLIVKDFGAGKAFNIGSLKASTKELPVACWRFLLVVNKVKYAFMRIPLKNTKVSIDERNFVFLYTCI